MNWARRNDCNMCNAPKIGIQEERTGLGGGFNERDGIEYKERVVSKLINSCTMILENLVYYKY